MKTYSNTYKVLSGRKNNRESWRQGMVSGNGVQGVVTSGAPYSDSLIFQHMHFIMPNANPRRTPDTSRELETVRQSIIRGEDIDDPATYDDVYFFHPGGALRLDFPKRSLRDYRRYTDYETAEVGVRFTDGEGEWERVSFTSQTDGVTVTRLTQSSKGKRLNFTLSFDAVSAMANFGRGSERGLLYKNTVNETADTIAAVTHYPAFDGSELRRGGYITLTYIVCEGGKTARTAGATIRDKQYAAKENPTVTVTDAARVYLISLTGRTDAMGEYGEFAAQEQFALYEELRQKAVAVAGKYTKNGAFSYGDALAAHVAAFRPLYNALSLKLTDAQPDLPNEALIRLQRRRKTMNAAFLERLYASGRYAYLCCCGRSATRLAGMWTGEFNPGWGSKFTMDANVNLQASSLNSSNLATAPVGYAMFILRQAPDWEKNAEATHGFRDALQAPVHQDGDCAALTETCYDYPFRYWNAGTSWMLQPLFETLQSYGDLKIPLCDEYDLEKVRGVLSLTDGDVARIRARGYLRLRDELLLPLLIKAANYWRQLLTPEYYTAADGSIHYEAGKTALSDGEYYCIVPSYSPENHPANYRSPSDANCAIDIAACRSNMEMLLTVAKESEATADTAPYEALLEKLPPYLYDETGALKEWATTAFTERNAHRHLSHLYCVWPLDETQNDAALRAACVRAVENRASENDASHALIHRALIALRLKDREAASTALHTLISHRIHYNSLMTNHDFRGGSAYCTDFAIGYLGIINESLLYSAPGYLELLPAMLTSGAEQGSVRGLRSRSRALLDMAWSLKDKTLTATVYSETEQTVTVACPLAETAQALHCRAGEKYTLKFRLK